MSPALRRRCRSHCGYGRWGTSPHTPPPPRCTSSMWSAPAPPSARVALQDLCMSSSPNRFTPTNAVHHQTLQGDTRPHTLSLDQKGQVAGVGPRDNSWTCDCPSGEVDSSDCSTGNRAGQTMEGQHGREIPELSTEGVIDASKT